MNLWTSIPQPSVPESPQTEHEKHDILIQLASRAQKDDLAFLIRVASSDREDWFTRAEVFRLLRDVEINDPQLNLQMAEAIEQVLRFSDEMTLRQWAGFCVARYLQYDSLLSAVQQVLRSEDDEIVYNIVDSLSEEASGRPLPDPVQAMVRSIAESAESGSFRSELRKLEVSIH